MLKKKIVTWVNEWSVKTYDKSELTFKLKIGLLLILLSFVVGNGLPFVLGVVGILQKRFLFMVTLGSVFYGLSWLIFGLGIILTGKANLYYGKIFLAKLLLRILK